MMMDELIVAAQSAAADECGTTTTTSSTTHGHHNNNDSAEASSTAMTKKKSDATTTTTTNTNTTTAGNNTSSRRYYPSFVRSGLYEEMVKQVVRKKLAKQRHLVLIKAIDATLLESLFQQMQKRHLFQPQTVIYNGGVANVPEWKISCYLEVMEGGIPTTAEPNVQLLQLYQPLLDAVNVIFMDWYRQQHACNNVVDPRVCRYSSSSSSSGKGKGGSVATSTTTSSTTTSNDDGTNHRRGSSSSSSSSKCCRRLMTFITRYTPRPGEEALLKHVDGAGKVDGSVVVALPMDESSPFEGGGLTFWDGVKRNDATGKCTKDEIHYDTRSGDLALIDRAVWHQADPITKGTRWALVIFYKVL